MLPSFSIQISLGRLLAVACLAVVAPMLSIPASAQQGYDPYAAPSLPPEELLLRTVPYFSQDNQPIANVFQAIGRSYGITIICDKDVTGNVNFESHNLSLRGVLDALCSSEGYFWNLEESGFISIRRFKTICYIIEYPKLEREVSTGSKVRLGNASSSSGVDVAGQGSSGSSGSSGSGGSGSNEDETTVELKSKSKADFWQELKKEIDAFKGKDEKVIFDQTAGLVTAIASRQTHEHIAEFISTVNGRLGQQIEILGKIVEVSLDNQNKLGVDWNLIRQATWGDILFNAGYSEYPSIDANGNPTTTYRAARTGTNTDITGMHGQSLAPDTFTATIGFGKIEAVVNALSQQGTLNTVTAPRLVTGNNQTAYIKDTEDHPFFQLSGETNQSTTGNSSDFLIQNKDYKIQTISIGTIVAVTPHIADNGDITLDIIPALTRLKEVLTSPDGQSNAPALYVKQMSTMVRLRSGETAIVGGIVTDTEATQRRGVPFLQDIPWVGGLFRTDAKVNQKTELVIFLTPRILIPGSTLNPEGLREAARDSRAVRGNLNVNGTRPASVSNPAMASSVESVTLFE